MKKIILLLCTVSLMTVACHKDEQDSSDSSQTEYPSTANVISNAVTDYDGNKYDAVKIGNQVWMASNLRTTHFANGDEIPVGETTATDQPYRYTPSTDVASYGYLYNWSAVMHGATSSTANPSGVQGVCPNGWHVPSDAEWTQLTSYCGSHSEYVCSGTGENIAKALAADHSWRASTNTCAVGNNLNANNTTGFSALPADIFAGSYNSVGSAASFWTATEKNGISVYVRDFGYLWPDVKSNSNPRGVGCSVRCVKD